MSVNFSGLLHQWSNSRCTYSKMDSVYTKYVCNITRAVCLQAFYLLTKTVILFSQCADFSTDSRQSSIWKIPNSKEHDQFNLPKFLKCGQSYQSFLTVFIRFVLTHIFTVFETVRLKSFNIHMWIIKGTYIHVGIVVTDVVLFVYFSAGGNMEGEPISPLRRTFCLIVLFDLIITVILWLIFTEVGGNVIS